MHAPTILATAVILAATSSMAVADVMSRVAETGIMRLGYRTDTPPFSAEPTPGNIEGYSIDICRVIADATAKELEMKVTGEFVPVTADTRFDALQNGEIDILCGATTATIARREMVDFSLPTFIDGAGVVVGGDVKIELLSDLGPMRLGVRSGTTTERALNTSFPDSAVTTMDDHADGMSAVRNGELDAYFADRTLLAFMLQQEPEGSNVKLANEFLTLEPYALAVPLGDSEFRLIVDRTISRLYKSGRINEITQSAFGDAKLGNMIEVLYKITPLPE